MYSFVLASLRAQECVKLCTWVLKLLLFFFLGDVKACVCFYPCARVFMNDTEMDVYISSWLHFPGLSLMALCSGAELLLPTYFMTFPVLLMLHFCFSTTARLLLPLLGDLHLLLYLLFFFLFAFLILSAFPNCPAYVGQNKMTNI